MKDPKLTLVHRRALFLLEKLTKSAEKVIHLVDYSQMSAPQKELKADILLTEQFLKAKI